ncbi:g8506 [Coccomyxa viridis]|uniref:G8506 protein n=1 Tax=Coccomyxa viridis TaxID=1274662 RepID=A0ABP1G333_9CHLO
MGESSAGRAGALPAASADVFEACRDDLSTKGSQKSDHGEEAVPEDSLRLASRPVTRGSKRKAGSPAARQVKKPVKLPAGATDHEILDHAMLDMDEPNGSGLPEGAASVQQDGIYVCRGKEGQSSHRQAVASLSADGHRCDSHVWWKELNLKGSEKARILPPNSWADACMKAVWVYVCGH